MKKSLMFLIAAATMVGCGANDKTSSNATAEESATAIKVCTAEIMEVENTETYTSEILPYRENDITPKNEFIQRLSLRIQHLVTFVQFKKKPYSIRRKKPCCLIE